MLLLINIALPAIFLLLRIPSFAIGIDPLWIIRWRNDAGGFGIQFNILPLLAIALLVGLFGLALKRR